MSPYAVGDKVLVQGTVTKVVDGYSIGVELFSPTDQYVAWVRPDLVTRGVVLNLDESVGGADLPGWLRVNARKIDVSGSGSPIVADMMWLADRIEAQIPTPRISEPKGRYAVVRDSDGHDWSRRGMTQSSSYEWINLETGDSWDWENIEEPSLISAGIEDAQ